ncbi:MAG: hypothetical protein ACLSAP_08465 [Oscillospiraceae bacterium]
MDRGKAAAKPPDHALLLYSVGVFSSGNFGDLFFSVSIGDAPAPILTPCSLPTLPYICAHPFLSTTSMAALHAKTGQRETRRVFSRQEHRLFAERRKIFEGNGFFTGPKLMGEEPLYEL